MGNKKDDGHTHYAGCACHEAEWERRLKELKVVIGKAIAMIDGSRPLVDAADNSEHVLLRKLSGELQRLADLEAIPGAAPMRIIEDAIDILDGNRGRIDWRDNSQPELLRKLCEALEERPVREFEHGKMLGQIASLVSDWCGPRHTTLDGVKLLLADWYRLKAAQLEESIPEE